eukprot:TRINITY_DN321_c1_g1_i1.p1 TRINITY_DN321_c1_g1~~TRINITY_DN321_c1_g1_i1.p1  ORF type:complete len:277 (-),score=31.41 TRINITY_DN321_c1_g1_i1:210-941(-)
MKAYERTLDRAAHKVFICASLMPGIKNLQNGIGFLPTKIDRWTVLTSPHVDKKSRETFERRTHVRFVSVEGPADVASKFTKFIIDHFPAGVSLDVTEHTFDSLDGYYNHPASLSLLEDAGRPLIEKVHGDKLRFEHPVPKIVPDEYVSPRFGVLSQWDIYPDIYDFEDDAATDSAVDAELQRDDEEDDENEEEEPEGEERDEFLLDDEEDEDLDQEDEEGPEEEDDGFEDDELGNQQGGWVNE